MGTAEYIETKLYKGKVIVRFYEKSHRYYVSVNGGKFESVTGVTTFIGIKDKSKPLGIWQQQVTCDFLLNAIAKKIKIDEDRAIEAVIQHELQVAEAADIGKEIHGWCEHYIRHQLKQKGYEQLAEIPKFPEAVNGVNSFLEWLEQRNVKFVSTERIVYSIKHGYIGMMDFDAVIDSKLCVGDFKSSNGLYNSVRMQTAAYGKADEEEIGKKKYKGRWAIRLSKYSEEEHYKREKRKQEIRRAIARIKGTEYKEYPIKPYQIFEAKFLDVDSEFYNRDFDAFLTAKKLHAWDRATDPFYQGEDW